MPPGPAERGKRQPLQRDHQHHRRDAERSRRSVAHHRQRTLFRPVAAQAVGGIGNAVYVQAAGGQQQRRHREQSGQRAGPAEGQRTAPADARGQCSQSDTDHRQRGHGAAAHRRVASPRYGQDRSERESRCQRTHHGEGAGGWAASGRVETPASANVAVDASAATAARSTGSATAAPLPSPSRIRRSRIGSNSSAPRASA